MPSRPIFFAFVGPGEFTLYLWDIRVNSVTWGKRTRIVVGQQNHRSVVIPPGVVHAYKNISDVPGWVFNAPDRLYGGEGKRSPVERNSGMSSARTALT